MSYMDHFQSTIKQHRSFLQRLRFETGLEMGQIRSLGRTGQRCFSLKPNDLNPTDLQCLVNRIDPMHFSDIEATLGQVGPLPQMGPHGPYQGLVRAYPDR